MLPVGTRLRISRLLLDNGDWGGVRVTATLENGTYSDYTIYLDRTLLEKNHFVWTGRYSSTNWACEPEIMEK